jgi:hypothetical protein
MTGDNEMSLPMKKCIQLLAGKSSLGQPVYEELLVEPCGPETYKLVASPGLVLGIAAGDTIRVAGSDSFEIVARGGNLSVQILRSQGVDEIEEFATEAMARVGGRLDGVGGRIGGKRARELVFTIPVLAGFAPIEQALNHIIERFPDAEWYYGNVYDPSDGVTPLNWWK